MYIEIRKFTNLINQWHYDFKH